MTQQFHIQIREACLDLLKEEPRRLCDLVDSLKGSSEPTVRLVASGGNANQRVSQILALDPDRRFEQVREIAAPSKRKWKLSQRPSDAPVSSP